MLCHLLVIASFAGCASSETRTQHLPDPAGNPGFVRFYNNDYDGAVAYFEDQVKAAPRDPDQYNHLAQSILYRQMFRNGALESQLVSGANTFLQRAKLPMSEQEKARFAQCIRKAESLSQAVTDKNPKDVRALYSLGVAHGLQANYFFLVEKAWIDALREATVARKADESILQIDPEFVDAKLIVGLNQYVVGSLPFFMRALGFFGGFHGDKDGGIRQLETVARCGVMNRYDASILLAVIYRREHRPRQAIPLLKELAQRFPENYLLRFEQVEMYSDAGDKTAALNVLDAIDRLRQSGAPGYSGIKPAKLRYLTGNIQFWYADLATAEINLKKATQNADELDVSTATLAWLRLGQVNDLQGRHREACEAYSQVMKIAPNSPVATEAENYLSGPYHRKKATQEGRGD